MGAAEVGVAGLAAAPAAILYDNLGEDLTWIIIGVLAEVAVERPRLHSSSGGIRELV